jgi:hypothetical protein
LRLKGEYYVDIEFKRLPVGQGRTLLPSHRLFSVVDGALIVVSTRFAFFLPGLLVSLASIYVVFFYKFSVLALKLQENNWRMQ